MSDSNKGDCNLADYCLARRDIYTCGKYTMLLYLLCAIRLSLCYSKENFLEGNFPEGNFPGGNFLGGNFPGGNFQG